MQCKKLGCHKIMQHYKVQVHKMYDKRFFSLSSKNLFSQKCDNWKWWHRVWFVLTFIDLIETIAVRISKNSPENIGYDFVLKTVDM